MKTLLTVAVLLYLFSASPLSAQQAMVVFGCFDRAQAEFLSAQMTDSNVPSFDPRWSTCQPARIAITDMENAKPILGPLLDWEGDPFALYEKDINGGTMYFIIYHLNGYAPAGVRA